MMLRIAWRSLATRPVRAAVLAAGFGFGISVMAELLGVGHVMLEQARTPALQGGGDVNADGFSDWMSGATSWDGFGYGNSGGSWLFYGSGQ